MRSLLRLSYILLLSASLCTAQNGTTLSMSPESESGRDTILQTNLRILGSDVLPFSGSKQNAVIVGVANVLGNAVGLSDIQLTVVKTYDSVSAYGNRRLLQQSNSYPAVDTQLNISTLAADAQNQADTLSSATNVTYGLASAIGAQGLQTQQIVFQSSQILPSQAAAPTAMVSTPPPAPVSVPSPATEPQSTATAPAPRGEVPSQTPASLPPAQAPSPLESGSGAANSAASRSTGSSLSAGGIAGIAVGGVALIALVALLAFLTMRRKVHTEATPPFTQAKPVSQGSSSNILAYSSSYGRNTSAASQDVTTDEKTEMGHATEKVEVK